MHVYTEPIHFVVQQKLTHHCKAAILHKNDFLKALCFLCLSHIWMWAHIPPDYWIWRWEDASVRAGNLSYFLCYGLLGLSFPLRNLLRATKILTARPFTRGLLLLTKQATKKQNCMQACGDLNRPSPLLSEGLKCTLPLHPTPLPGKKGKVQSQS